MAARHRGEDEGAHACGGRAPEKAEAWAASRGGATLALAFVVGLATLATANVVYQLARKPAELLGLVTPSPAKAPEATAAEDLRRDSPRTLRRQCRIEPVAQRPTALRTSRQGGPAAGGCTRRSPL